MKYMSLDLKDGVYSLNFGSEENKANTLTEEVMDEFIAAFDEIEASKEATALVITSSNPKFWCAGLDLNWLKTKPDNFLQDDLGPKIDEFLRRLALLNCPTIGCLTGHAYGGGALAAMACDFRFMNEEEGKLCFPEIMVKIPFTPLMQNLINLALPPQTMKWMTLTASALDAQEALKSNAIDKAFAPGEILEQSLEFARDLTEKDRRTYSIIKRQQKEILAQ